MRTRSHTRRFRRLAASILVVGALSTTMASPASAFLVVDTTWFRGSIDWGKIGYRTTYAKCTRYDDPNLGERYWPRGQARAFEYGKSGVMQFEGKFFLFTTGKGPGLNFSSLRTGTYYSSYFYNDDRSLARFFPAPGQIYDDWYGLDPRFDRQMDVKIKYVRPGRRSWRTQRIVTVCNASSPYEDIDFSGAVEGSRAGDPGGVGDPGALSVEPHPAGASIVPAAGQQGEP